MGFAIPAGLLFIGTLLIATAAIQHALLHSANSSLAEAQSVWRDKIYPNKWARLSLLNATYNETAGRLDYDIYNNGSESYDYLQADLYRNGKKYSRTATRTDQSGLSPEIVNPEVFDPGETLTRLQKITDIDSETDNEFTYSTPSGAKVTFTITI